MFGLFKKKQTPQEKRDLEARMALNPMFNYRSWLDADWTASEQAEWDRYYQAIMNSSEPAQDVINRMLSEQIDASAAASAVEEEKLCSEFPEFQRFLNTYPYTKQDYVDFENAYEDAREVAALEVRRDNLRYGRKVTEEENEFLIRARAVELAIETLLTADAIDLAERQGSHQALQNILEGNKLDGIRTAIDRSAVAANAIDTMKAHPFLTGFLGAHVVSKLKG